ncbi:MAG: undecaprenyl-diphosphatase UppP [Bacteroidales bacterium]|nr:undecaprenyl-diphosphatase UppP [Bacteroidales bacterium]
MSVWEAILLGVIQGLTEFLPISSTAHLVVARQLLGHPHPEDAFTTIIQMGTLGAVFAYFRADIAVLLRGVWGDLRQGRPGTSPASRMAWRIGLGSIPAGLVGLLRKDWLKQTFFHMQAIAWVAIIFALLMAASEWWIRRRERLGRPHREEADVTLHDALWVGLWQAMALMPGGSRSGTTITAGLFAGLSRPAAARFSFLLSLPIILAAGAKEFWDERAELLASGSQIIALGAGLLSSALVGYLAIAWLLGFLKRYSMMVFILYRIGLGVWILAMLAVGWLQP